jgi:sugar/nucleoside kinase (ribokinase family)
MKEAQVDIMMIGHMAKDLLLVDGQGDYAPGGAVYYGSIALRRLGVEVAVVTRLHTDDYVLLDELRREGVHVYASPAPATSGIENRYDSTDMERRVCSPLGFAGPMQEADIPDISAAIYMAAGIMAGEVELALLQSLARRGPVGLDVQGFVRVPEGEDLVFRPWADMEEGLACVTYLKVDRAEAELLTGKTDLEEAARRLASYGPHEIVLTQSSGVTVLANGRIHRARFTPRSLAGRTGRGDTCFCTYVGQRLTKSPEEATRLAAAVTTLKQEQPGPWRGTLADVELLLAKLAE